MELKPKTEFIHGTESLVRRLLDVEVGQLVSYETLSAHVGVDVQKSGRPLMDKARRHAQHRHQAVFEPVHNRGLKRLSDSEIVHTGSHTLRRIRRAAVRGGKKLVAVKDFSALSNDDKVRFNVHAGTLGVIASLTEPKRITAAIQQMTPQQERSKQIMKKSVEELLQ